MSKTFEILEWTLWDGKITSEQCKLFARITPIIKDVNRPEDPTIYSWYEHTKWIWKQYEYSCILSHINLNSPKHKKIMDAGCG